MLEYNAQERIGASTNAGDIYIQSATSSAVKSNRYSV